MIIKCIKTHKRFVQGVKYSAKRYLYGRIKVCVNGEWLTTNMNCFDIIKR